MVKYNGIFNRGSQALEKNGSFGFMRDWNNFRFFVINPMSYFIDPKTYFVDLKAYCFNKMLIPREDAQLSFKGNYLKINNLSLKKFKNRIIIKSVNLLHKDIPHPCFESTNQSFQTEKRIMTEVGIIIESKLGGT